jgi:hypothetical protein
VIGRIVVRGQPGQRVSETPHLNGKKLSGVPVIPVTAGSIK